MKNESWRVAVALLCVVSVLLGSCEETQPRGDTGTPPVALAAFAEEAPEAWVYDARTGLWSPSVFTVVVAGTELYRDGRLYRVTSAGLVDRGAVAPEALDAAEETYVAEALHWTPGPDDWVLVLGAHGESGHVPLRDVRPGERFAYQGRIFETRPSSSGSLDVRHTGEVLSSVEQTIARRVHDVIDASIQYADGTTETIRATPDHPFYLPSHRGYVDLRDVEIGSTLHVSGGGEALLVSKTWRQGDFEVFNFEVAEQHNYFVRSAGSEQSGLLVHNARCTPKKGDGPCDPVRQAADAIIEYLGPGWEMIINDAGDYIFRNAANNRRVQFHLNDFSPHDAPHGHVDRKPGKKRWYKCKNDPIYFK